MEGFVNRQEFIPIVDKVDDLMVEQAVLSTQFKHLSDNVSDMKNYLQSIDDKMSKLVTNEAMRQWIIKASFWMIGTVLVPSITLLTMHFTQVAKAFNDVFLS